MVSVLDTNQTIRERCMPAKIDLIPSMATPTSSKISAGYGRTYAGILVMGSICNLHVQGASNKIVACIWSCLCHNHLISRFLIVYTAEIWMFFFCEWKSECFWYCTIRVCGYLVMYWRSEARRPDHEEPEEPDNVLSCSLWTPGCGLPGADNTHMRECSSAKRFAKLRSELWSLNVWYCRIQICRQCTSRNGHQDVACLELRASAMAQKDLVSCAVKSECLIV
jgi:hypothetical protein